MNFNLLFCDMSCKLFKISKKWFTGLLFTRIRLNSKQRVAEVDRGWHTLRIQMDTFLDESGDYIQDVTCSCNYAYIQKKRTTLPVLGGGLAGVIVHFSDLSYWHATTET